MSDFVLPTQYEYKLESMPRGKDQQAMINHTCTVPYNTLVIDYNSNCLICSCDGWLPIPVGQVSDFETLDQVWQSPAAKILQKDVTDKKFTWCAVDHCGIKTRDIITKKYSVAINIDESCNLYCPSCRREKIMHTQGPEYDRRLADVKKIVCWLEKFQHPVHITLSGNGDPLASAVIRPLIHNFVPKPNQTFTLFTNGLLIKKQLEKSNILDHITRVWISVDAGSREVYENVRRGGSWSTLIENFDFLSDKKKNHLVSLNFAVQKNNFEDLYNFVELCRKYNFKCLIHQLDDWGTWNKELPKNPDSWTLINGTYSGHAVLKTDHPDHDQCIAVLNNIARQKNNFVNFSPVIKSLMAKQ
jgi:molybdenum cofactor biosynthesis enzyme MoaA